MQLQPEHKNTKDRSFQVKTFSFSGQYNDQRSGTYSETETTKAPRLTNNTYIYMKDLKATKDIRQGH